MSRAETTHLFGLVVEDALGWTRHVLSTSAPTLELRLCPAQHLRFWWRLTRAFVGEELARTGEAVDRYT
jgi:hypothetical protein